MTIEHILNEADHENLINITRDIGEYYEFLVGKYNVHVEILALAIHVYYKRMIRDFDIQEKDGVISSIRRRVNEPDITE